MDQSYIKHFIKCIGASHYHIKLANTGFLGFAFVRKNLHAGVRLDPLATPHPVKPGQLFGTDCLKKDWRRITEKLTSISRNINFLA